MGKGKKKDFLDKIAHDLKTPLHVIKTYIDLSSALTEDEDLQAFRKAAASSYEKILKMVDSLNGYDFEITFEKSICDVVVIIKSVIAELKVFADDKGVRLSFVGPEHLIGFVDSLATERVVQNLVKNAIQALVSEKNNKYVEVRLLQKGHTILIDVKDNGCGIAPQNIRRIFKKGYTHGAHNGTGVGLAYCREVIKKHKGHISVHSQVEKGTLFSVTIPAAAVATCYVENSRQKSSRCLQIWASDKKNDNLSSWIEQWQEDHKTTSTKNVQYHKFMIDYEEDSIGHI